MGEWRQAGTEPVRSEYTGVLSALRGAGAVDFSGFKPQLIEEHVRTRMESLGLHTLTAYRGLLATSADERELLAGRLLIKVTSFFRDQEAWDFLRQKVVPELLSGAGTEREIRVWSTGCSTGEEAYSLAILLAEALGTDEFLRRVKIYATDADQQAVRAARSGLYDARALKPLSDQWRATYFQRYGRRYRFRPDLRRALVFGRHDLIGDMPLPRIDLLACRNTMLYFTPRARDRTLDRFHFALREGGFLFLGRAEVLLNNRHQFLPVHPRQRVYRRRPDVAARPWAETTRAATRRRPPRVPAPD